MTAIRFCLAACLMVSGRRGPTLPSRRPIIFDRPDGEFLAEVARLGDLGARPVDIGQRDVPWVVLADPEDNEFCLLGRRVDL